MNAYEKHYLYDAMLNMANAVDSAVHEHEIEPDSFVDMFIASGYADLFEKGNPGVIAGISGRDLALRTIDSVVSQKELAVRSVREVSFAKTPEYWAGWVLAYWQWKTGRSFKEILDTVKLSEIVMMYHPYHEMDEARFVEDAEKILTSRKKESPVKLAVIRKNMGISQSELARKSGINIRSIQQYEQRAKDIYKAEADTVYKLAKALNCDMRELIEH